MSLTVREYIDGIEFGTLFIADDIDTESTYDSVKTQLCKACAEGRIERVHHGVYYKPEYDPEIDRNIPYSKRELAYAIARMNDWRIIPDGDVCLNMLGLSTQVPAKYVFLSDGPYKIYEIDGKTIEFRHRAPKNYPKDEFSAMVVQAIKAQTRDNCDRDFINKLSRAIPVERRNSLIENTSNTSAWIRNVIREACADGH